MIWVIVAIPVLAIAWFLVKLLAAYTVKPEFSGKAMLKQSSKTAGVDISLIPEAAWDEITSRLIMTAKSFAWAGVRQEERNWRANLVRLCQTEAFEIGHVIRSGKPRMSNADPLFETLVKYGVIKPQTSVAELSRLGQEYAEMGALLNLAARVRNFEDKEK